MFSIGGAPGTAPGRAYFFLAAAAAAAAAFLADFSSSATLVGLRFSHSLPLGPGTLSLLARLDNLFDRVYAGAVIVNDGNGRYFETAAARNALLALRWQAPF